MLLAFVCMSGYAQKPLSYSTIIQKEGASAQDLYDLTRQWFAEYYHDSKSVLQNQNPGKELSGRAATRLEIKTLTYSGMSGYINYMIDVQFREGRLKLTLDQFSHDPIKEVKYNNHMGTVLDSLPEDLKSLGGDFEKSSFRMYYKHFYKYARPVCDDAFNNVSKSLKKFIETREAKKDDDW